MRKLVKINRNIAALMSFALGALITLSGCNGKFFKERPSETPAPDEQVVEKSFFVDPSGKPKTFIIGAATVKSHGMYQMMLGYHRNAHVNIEWEVTEGKLIGREINPSRPNDRKAWREYVTIPIVKHFYYEKNKDQYGREENNYIQNERSHWSARPMMKLNLLGTEFPGFDGSFDQVTAVREIEWDRENNFLGFTTSVRPLGGWGGGYSQVLQEDVRVNFLEFKHNPKFKKVPYHHENSRYMNILHVMGRKNLGKENESYQNEYYAARWDFSNGPQKLYINQAPPEIAPIIVEVVEKWNQTFKKIGVTKGNQKAFEPIVKDLPYSFDLRYPAITWVKDREISFSSPLGVGMAHADVRNGQILWGSVMLWGGALQDYISRYTPNQSSMAPQGMEAFSGLPVLSERVQVNLDNKNSLPSSSTDLQTQMFSTNDEEEASGELSKLPSPLAQSIRFEYSELIRSRTGFSDGAQGEKFLAEKLGLRKELSKEEALESFEHMGVASYDPAQIKNILNSQKMSKQSLLNSELLKQSSIGFVEEGYNLENLGPQIVAQTLGAGRPYREVLEAVVMDLALHEVGHMINLGHQFKGNIVPPQGQVPEKFRKVLLDNSTHENGFSNYTSVMDYKSGFVDTKEHKDHLGPGEHDKLTLRYLYKGEYSTLDRKKDEFQWFRVPKNGLIPRVTHHDGQSFPVAYFPACNDFDASFYADPYCNRWDMGSRAEDIVANYFNLLTDSLVTDLYALNGTRGMSWIAEWRLWSRSRGIMNRVRLFYDEMRRIMKEDDELKPLWNLVRKSKDDLLDFSRACREGGRSASPALKKLVTEPRIADLCLANLESLKNMSFLMNLPQSDYTKILLESRYSSSGYLAGDGDSDRRFAFGGWTQLSNFPLKLASLLNLTSATPSFDWGWSTYRNLFYDTPDYRFLYRTMYPREYTQLLASSMESNLNFPALDSSDATTMGKTVLASSWLVPYQKFESNEAKRLPTPFNRMLDQQTEFQLSVVAVLIEPQVPDPALAIEADHYQAFGGEIFDLLSGKKFKTQHLYLLPKGEVFVKAPNMFLFPLTKMKFYDGAKSYILAFRLTWDFEVGDSLEGESIKFKLNRLHTQLAATCVEGNNRNGLSQFFKAGGVKNKSRDFEGFRIPPDIALETRGQEKTRIFYDSVQESFDRYQLQILENERAENLTPRRQTIVEVCEEARKGMGQILSAAGLMSGYWRDLSGLASQFLDK